jgi:hypothetical protein
MSGEEKSIEEIIAELESIENKKVDKKDSVEHDETVLMDASAIKDEYKHPSEEEPLEGIIDEKASSEIPTEEVFGEASHEKLVLEKRVEEEFQKPSSEDIFAEAPREELVLDEIVEEEPQEVPSETIFEKTPHEELILDEPFEERPLEKPSEEVFGEESHEELIFEKPVEDQLSELTPDELRDVDVQKEPTTEPTSEQMFASMEEEGPPEGPSSDEYGDEPPDEPPLPPEVSKPPSVSRMTILLGFALIALISVAYFVWPTMYEYKTTTVKGYTYKVRINRLTSLKEYDVMGKWQSMPPSEKSMYRARIKVPSKTPETTAKTDFEKAREVAQVRAKAKADAEAKAKAKAQTEASLNEAKTVTVKASQEQPEKVEVIVAKKEPEKAVTESAQTEPIEATKEVTIAASIPPAQPAAVQEPVKTVSVEEKSAKEPKVMVLVKKEVPKPEKKGGYAIQIASMRFEEFAEELVEELGNKGLDGHMDTIKSKRGGMWHTVLIGHFSDKGQARAFMKEKKITKTYPGCYIRKLYDR